MIGPLATDAFRDANADWLGARLERLRLQLRRRALWVRALDGRGAGAFGPEPPADAASAEVAFLAGDADVAEVARAIAALDARLAVLEAEVGTSGRRPALRELAEAFGLAGFEEDVLLLAVAPAVDAAFERIFAALQDGPDAAAPTLQLAAEVFLSPGRGRLLACEALAATRPLRRFRLLELEDGSRAPPLAARPLRAAERVVELARGTNRPDGRLARVLRPVPAPLLTPAQDAVAAMAGRELARGDRWPVVNLVGALESGARDVAAAACARAGLRLHAVDLAALGALGDVERDELRAVAEREAVLCGLAILVDAEPAADAGDPQRIRALARDWIDRLAAPCLVVSPAPWATEEPACVLEVPRPDRRAQHELWRTALARIRHDVAGELAAIAEQFDLGPRAIREAVEVARQRAERRAGAEARLSAADLWDACRDLAGPELEALGRRMAAQHGWDDLVLPPDAIAQLHELAAQVEQRARVYERWGFGRQLGRGRGITALFAGASGCGKTMAAEILAGALRLDLYRIDLAGVVSKYVGETEKNLRRVFDAAERSGVILLFDEADALFGTRTEVRDSHDRYANIEVNYLLQRMEDYAGLAILATNRRAAIDDAFLRRLRFVVEFPFPSLDDRRRIWERVFPPEAEREALDLTALARLELPGGHIRSIAINAAFLAAARGAPIGMGDVLRAARREYAKLSKPVGAVDLRPVAGGAGR